MGFQKLAKNYQAALVFILTELKNITLAKTNRFRLQILHALCFALLIGAFTHSRRVSAVCHCDLGDLANMGYSEPTMKKRMTKPLQVDLQPGVWGGPGIVIVVGKRSSRIELDCSVGEIPKTFRISKSGSFRLVGTYTRRSFGAVQRDSPSETRPAVFEGKVTGEQMNLKILIAKSRELIGSYILHAGESPEMARCY